MITYYIWKIITLIIRKMIHILTGLPHNKNNDKNICINFSKSIGHKIILGSSTMKMYCRELNIKAKIEILETDDLPTPKYLIDGIDIASEGVLTLNEIYALLLNNKSTNTEAKRIVNLIKTDNEIIFTVGTANNKESEFYKQNNLLSRVEIIEKIVELLKNKTIKVNYI
jgi:hypothetical protein